MSNDVDWQAALLATELECTRLRQELFDARAERDRLRPVVVSAIQWAERWSSDEDNKTLESAVEAYRAQPMGEKP